MRLSGISRIFVKFRPWLITVDIWQRVRKELKSTPIAEGIVGDSTPLFAERYLLHGINRTVKKMDVLVLVTQFGGSRVREGDEGHWRADTLPNQSLLIPRNCETHWHYSGTTDFGTFYFPRESLGMTARFLLLTEFVTSPLQFSNSLVSAASLQIFNELHKGSAADEQFIAELAHVMLEQTYRVLTTPDTGEISPRHIHFARLQRVLPYIREHLAEDLSAQALADLAGVSIRHFCRLFQDALGVPVHRYVQTARLEKARKQLGTTTMPISSIAQECGYSSQSHLTASFKSAHAATPLEYRSQLTRSSDVNRI